MALRALRRIDTFNGVFVLQGPPQPGQPFKFSVGDSCDRIKEEFNFLQAQYHRYPILCIYGLINSQVLINRRHTEYFSLTTQLIYYKLFAMID